MSRMTPELLWALKRVGQPEPLPDGESAVVPVTTYDIDANEGTTHLYLIELDGEVGQLTRGISSTAPAVSPDGRQVAFLRKADPDSKAQLQVIPLGGGEPQTVTEMPLGVQAAKWAPANDGIVIAAPLLRGFPTQEATIEELERRGDRPRPLVTEDRTYRFLDRWLVDGETHHLFYIELASGELRHLTTGWDGLLGWESPEGAFDIESGGSEIAFAGIPDLSNRDRNKASLFTVSINGGPPQRATGSDADEFRPRYSPDGTRILYGMRREWDFYADPMRLVTLDRASGTETPLTDDWDASASGWEFESDESILLGALDHGRLRGFRTAAEPGIPKAITPPRGTSHGLRPAGGQIWLRHESLTRPPDVAILETGGEIRPLTSFNQDVLADTVFGETEELYFAGASGDPVQAYLVYPPGFDATRPWPLVHTIHGGPHSLFGDDWHWRWNQQTLAAAGYVVAAVNFHGSTSWGEEFTRSIRGAWGDKPATDIMRATDEIIERGFIDPERVAITGGSYGGYLVAWLTSQTDRFACAVNHAGVADLVGEWASDMTVGWSKATGGTPWEDLDATLRWSPVAHAGGMNTPMLIMHGARDFRVVTTQGLALYGILVDKGVQARLAYYPEEGHLIEKPQSSLHWYAELLGWLERFLGAAEEGSTPLES